MQQADGSRAAGEGECHPVRAQSDALLVRADRNSPYPCVDVPVHGRHASGPALESTNAQERATSLSEKSSKGMGFAPQYGVAFLPGIREFYSAATAVAILRLVVACSGCATTEASSRPPAPASAPLWIMFQEDLPPELKI